MLTVLLRIQKIIDYAVKKAIEGKLKETLYVAFVQTIPTKERDFSERMFSIHTTQEGADEALMKYMRSLGTARDAYEKFGWPGQGNWQAYEKAGVYTACCEIELEN